MYKSEWLHRTKAVDSEPLEVMDITDVAHKVRAMAADAGKRNPGNEPDSFRVLDSSGAEIGAFSVSDGAFDGSS